MISHTPGPWAIGNQAGDNRIEACANGGITVALVYELEWPGDRGEMEANKHLIASAPDLLEQLELAATALEQASADKDRRIAVREADSRRAIEARRAIAKAKGAV